jgi:hypothetical protein
MKTYAGGPMVQGQNIKHSEYGVTSFSVSIFWFLCAAISAFFQGILPGTVQQVLMSFVCFATFVIPLVTFVLGIIGILQRNRKKLFAILGTIFSAVFLISYLAFIIYMMNVMDDPRVFIYPSIQLTGIFK